MYQKGEIHMEELIIHLEWSGPYKLSQLNDICNESTDYGVYQVYGAHPIYGSNVLLYIGKADVQTFGVRIKEEGWEYNQDPDNVQIYIGRLAGNSTPSDEKWSKEIELAEKLLIFTHKPAFNSQYIKSLPDKELQNIHVLNWSNSRDLMPEVSGSRWTSKYDEMPAYKVYGSHDT